jgi:hypothetical protein
MWLLARAGLTVAVEVLYFLAVGPRAWDFLVVCALCNGITNLSLNLCLCLLVQGLGLTRWYLLAVILLELLATAGEFLCYRNFLYRDRGRHRGLLGRTIVANLLSVLAGLMLG